LDGLSVPFNQTNIDVKNVNQKVSSELFEKPSGVNALNVISSAHSDDLDVCDLL
jgi:hypothetical protein